jgi:flavodoxin I
MASKGTVGMFRFDEADPRFLIVYTGDEHPGLLDYERLGERWIARLEQGERFGVIMVDEPHEHHHDEDDEEHHKEEAAIMHVINEFRRQYRAKTSKLNVGYARVVPTIWLEKYYSEPGTWEQALAGNNRQAQYNWGIPGGGFLDLESAKAWILEQFNRPVENTPDEPTPTGTINGRIGMFYGSSTGVTEYIANEIAEAWQQAGMEAVEVINIGTVKDAAQLLAYDALILGIPTWNIGELQDDWDILFPALDDLDFSGKQVAIFGIGDQYGYPDNYLDAVGILCNKLLERGATLVGTWYDEHYEFSESVGFVDGKFMGLGIDEVNQSKLTGKRVKAWVEQIIREFALQPVAAQ